MEITERTFAQLLFDNLHSTFSETASVDTVVEHVKEHYQFNDTEIVSIIWKDVLDMKKDLLSLG